MFSSPMLLRLLILGVGWMSIFELALLTALLLAGGLSAALASTLVASDLDERSAVSSSRASELTRASCQ